MTDISKCPGDGCPVKESCCRFTVPGHEYWQAFIPPGWDGKQCEFYKQSGVNE